MAVEFIDNSMNVTNAIDDAVSAFLYEAAGEVAAQTARKTPVDSGHLKGSWTYIVDESAGVATIGSPLENAIWNEYGTGEYAAKGDGRKGGWYVHESKLSAKAKKRMKKVIGKDGKIYYFTYGKRPQRTFETVFNALKDKIIRRAEQLFGERLG